MRTDIVCTNNTETNLVSLQDGGFLLHFLVLDVSSTVSQNGVENLAQIIEDCIYKGGLYL